MSSDRLEMVPTTFRTDHFNIFDMRTKLIHHITQTKMELYFIICRLHPHPTTYSQDLEMEAPLENRRFPYTLD